MAIQWSGISGRMRVGIDISFSAISSGSTSVNVTVEYYIQIVEWRYSDSQTLVWDDPSGQGSFGYDNQQGSTGTYVIKILTRTYNQAISYSGGPTHSASARLSGAYDGSAPSLTRTYTIPARSSSVPNAPAMNIDSVTSTSMRSVLTAPSNNGSPILEYQTQLDDSSDWASPLGTASGGSRVWTGLTPARSYFSRGRARNAFGWGPWSATDVATTGASVPFVPGSFTHTNVQPTSVQVSWTTPNNGGSGIQAYQVQIARNSGFTVGMSARETTSLTYVWNELSPGTAHWIRVRARNGVGWGQWTAARSFTTLAGTPTITSPTSGTQSRGWPYAIVSAIGISSATNIVMEYSTSSTFAAVEHTVTYSPSGPSSNDRYTVQNTTLKVPNGTWYTRAKVINTSSGYTTPWSATVSITVSHTPGVSASSPVAGSVIGYSATTPFRFRFTDPSTIDRISAYQLIVERNSDGGAVFNGNKTLISGNANPQDIEVTAAIPSTARNETLRYRVRVWDRDDQVSSYTGYTIFTLADPPTVTISTPANAAAVDNGAPTFLWNVVVPSGGTQATAMVEVFETVANKLIWSAQVSGSTRSVQPNKIILANGISYYVRVTVVATDGLVGSTISNFTASYSAPDVLRYSFDGSGADDFGYIEVNWEEAEADPLFTGWKVYRLQTTTSVDNWELVFQTSDQNIGTFRDFSLVADEVYSFSVTQTAYRSGSILESPVGYFKNDSDVQISEDRETVVRLSHYWLIDPRNRNNSLQLPNVISDDSELEFETEEFVIIGRGRHQDEGDEMGYSGTLVVQIRGYENQSSLRARIEALRRSRSYYYLRTPFGRLIQVALGNLSWSPLTGTGSAEMGDMTIPYKQVA